LNTTVLDNKPRNFRTYNTRLHSHSLYIIFFTFSWFKNLTQNNFSTFSQLEVSQYLLYTSEKDFVRRTCRSL